MLKQSIVRPSFMCKKGWLYLLFTQFSCFFLPLVDVLSEKSSDITRYILEKIVKITTCKYNFEPAYY